MGVQKSWLKNQPFARNAPRHIDRETMLDLLGIIKYEADRHTALEDVGFSDNEPSVDCLFDYVLDALGIPPESEEFSRQPFEMIFYNDYWLESQFASLEETLIAIEQCRDEFIARREQVATKRAGIRLVESEDSDGT